MITFLLALEPVVGFNKRLEDLIKIMTAMYLTWTNV